jgi:antitoxin component of RelBE/YafQ-DinJ toxin-antitoxin module
MKKEYDFSKMQGKRNPYATQLKQQSTIRINRRTVSYLKKLSEQEGVSYQNLIDSYLTKCAEEKMVPVTHWCAEDSAAKEYEAGKLPVRQKRGLTARQ